MQPSPMAKLEWLLWSHANSTSRPVAVLRSGELAEWEPSPSAGVGLHRGPAVPLASWRLLERPSASSWTATRAACTGSGHPLAALCGSACPARLATLCYSSNGNGEMTGLGRYPWVW